jgi:hypothetical protein
MHRAVMELGVGMSNWRLTKLAEIGEVNRACSRHRSRDAAHLYDGPIHLFRLELEKDERSGGYIIHLPAHED